MKKESLREYIDTFDKLCNKVELHEEVIIEMFVGGLRKEIHSMVLLSHPKSLKEAFAMARL